MILSGRSIRERGIMTPHCPRTHAFGMSYGESVAGYDVRISEAVELYKGNTTLAVTLERFTMPNDILGVVHDKSTLARLGVQVQNTIIEPSWRGHLTLEISFAPLVGGVQWMTLPAGSPIAQVIFHVIDTPTAGYAGKYQDAIDAPQHAIFEMYN